MTVMPNGKKVFDVPNDLAYTISKNGGKFEARMPGSASVEASKAAPTALASKSTSTAKTTAQSKIDGAKNAR